ncbi:helix-turn-helix transcriptional regulator [Lactobacillus sp. YT155]|uniref:helix-turn-helix domain-containing protein n=1 Tax=Lactobacillus sp. YT155 TaxID=3060955 RepID=UPI00265F1454|nr:helix-turn-helix transcriptional regulator [Lactobacillus sp. YT155]MDO1604979.1 helix-turn-helix transcriptional regulator [Lactobacillus sp. YT155]
MSELSKRLKKRRVALSMSISKTAEAAGISDSSLSRFERGVFKSISAEHLEALASALDISMADLYGPEKASIYRGKNTEELIDWLDSLAPEQREHTSQLLLELLKTTNKKD